MPVSPAVSRNCFACIRPFCPVVASSTISVSTSAPGSSRSMMRRIFESSFMRFCLLCSRPAVSIIITSAPRALPAHMPSYTTAAGSLPSSWRTMSAPVRSAHMPSCSAAAARKVSPAHSSTFLPSAISMAASFPIVVVFPTPFTPTISMTDGVVESFRLLSPVSRYCISISIRHSFAL